MALRMTSVLLVPAMLLVWCGPVAAEARAPAPGEAEPAPVDGDMGDMEDMEDMIGEPEVEEAQRLFTEGANKFETADYAGAIELWTEAYGIVPSVPEYAEIKAKLIANLAAAHERAYAVDNEVTHLNQAKILLESYRESLDEIYSHADEVEREHELAWVSERVGKIDAELQAVAEREAAAHPPDPEPKRERVPGQGLVIGGSVLAGLGVAGLGVMVGGMVIGGQNNDVTDLPSNDLDARADRFAQGRLGNTLAIAGGVGGAVLVGTGVALLMVGLKKKRAAGSEAEARAALVPILDPTQVGLSLVGRF